MTEVKVDATDGAVKTAADLGLTDHLNEGKIEGSGENGRIQANDVKDYFNAHGAGKEPAGAEAEETSPNTDADDLAAEAEEDEDDEDEFDAEEGEQISPRLAQHLTDTGLDILEAENDDEEIQAAIDQERDKREVAVDEEDEDTIDLLKKFARIMRKPMSRSQVARRSQQLLTRLGYDWTRDED